MTATEGLTALETGDGKIYIKVSSLEYIGAAFMENGRHDPARSVRYISLSGGAAAEILDTADNLKLLGILEPPTELKA